MVKRLFCLLCVLVMLGTAGGALAQDIPDVVQLAINDLSARLGVQVSVSDLSSWQWSQRTDFPDTSLDCPQPGQTYAQVISRGFVVSLVYNGVLYDYRVTNDKQSVFLCTPGAGVPGDQGEAPAPAATLTPAPAPAAVSAPACAGNMPVRLAVGMQGRAITTGSINIRDVPGLSDTNTVAGLLLPGAEFTVIGGPQCATDQTWWQISYNSSVGVTTGWVMEGDAAENDYWLEPVGGVQTVQQPVGPVGGAPISSLNAAQLQPAMRQPLAQPIQRAAFVGRQPTDVLVSTALDGSLAYYDGTSYTPKTTPMGHPGAFVYLLDAAVPAASPPLYAMVEQGSSGAVVWVWESTADDPSTIREKFGFQLGSSANALALSADGKYLAVGMGTLFAVDPTTPNEVVLWDVELGLQFAVLTHSMPVLEVAFSPDGRLLAVAEDANTVRVWDIATQTEIATLEGGTSILAGENLAFSPDGTLLASAGNDGAVYVWDITVPVLRFMLQVTDQSPVRFVAFSPDGSTLAVSGVDPLDREISAGISLWSTALGTQLVAFPDFTETMTGLTFSRDGTQLIALSDQSWWVWTVP
ncbi:MAG: hypothetical protein JW966_03795 [Anaerolineae bacterium]|nr:hypothetical protein [Anaerolineae bacterium]